MSEKKPATKVIERILLEHENRGGVPLERIAEESMDEAYTNNLDCRRIYISRILRSMKEQSRVKKVKWGYWRLTEERERYLRKKRKERIRERLASGDVL